MTASVGQGGAAVLEAPAERARGRLGGTLGLALRGSAWAGIGQFVGQGVRLGTTLVLARALLTDEAFGLFSIVTVLLAAAEMLSDLGLGTNVVQHARGHERAFLGTALSVQAMRGVVLWGVLSALAMPCAAFYDEPALVGLQLAAATTMLVRGVMSTSVWTLTREVRLRGVTTLNLAAEVAGAAVSIGWALASPTAWALVGGSLASAVVMAAGSHVLGGWRDRFSWERSSARQILVFGGWMFASTATYFLSTQAERLALGKFVGVAELGQFAIAAAVASFPVRGVTQVVAQVFFPIAAASVRTGRGRAVRQFRVVKWLSLAAGLGWGLLLVTAGPWLTRELLGEKFAGAAWMVGALGVRAALEIFGASTGSMLFAFGEARFQAAGNTARLLVIAAGLAWAFGLHGVREAVWVLALAPVAVYGVAATGLWKRCPEAFRIECVTFGIFVAVMAPAVLLARG